ncbi:N-acetylmuramoyl-L-alanine amidase AmpD [Arcticibacter svalbardensis MN12-7]|uniref:N-acetylmuramoyl-L-alanine amidase n=1 Tax=Arcticibacter svalbardensis MN12-7 TaxID=1150600 RepID=R9GUK9_9SPHI|nr:N-acetylmuramoyl-L-alanine amidase [Arcticibacter svalbardensis]EOR95180.1 N-acetylmuramoyl-L-alanine amidase AmpD [Arcticibacter svalbardensis MN12-7]
MKIQHDLLFADNGKQVPFKATPNMGGTYNPQYLILHYTAATTTESTLNWFPNPIAQASAHLLIGRDGAITQFLPFNRIAWHAGKSEWAGLVGMNKFSIGIELVNGGRLTRSGDKWVCSVDMRKVPDQEVIMAVHKNETHIAAWQEYTENQLEVSTEIAALLISTYNLKDVLGHEDISPIRKSDPGPAFPMASFRSKTMGREDETIDEFITATALNIRSGPATTFPTLTDPLPPGVKVNVLKTETTWSFVEVLENVNGIMDLEGWVSSKFLRRN